LCYIQEVLPILQFAIGLGERVAPGDALPLPGQTRPSAVLGLRKGYLPTYAAQQKEDRQ